MANDRQLASGFLECCHRLHNNSTNGLCLLGLFTKFLQRSSFRKIGSEAVLDLRDVVNQMCSYRSLKGLTCRRRFNVMNSNTLIVQRIRHSRFQLAANLLSAH